VVRVLRKGQEITTAQSRKHLKRKNEKTLEIKGGKQTLNTKRPPGGLAPPQDLSEPDTLRKKGPGGGNREIQEKEKKSA